MAKIDQSLEGEDYFSQFQLPDQEEYRGPSGKTAKEDAEDAKSDADRQLEALKLQFAELNGQIKAMQQSQLVSQAGTQSVSMPEPPAPLDLSDLPSPLEDEDAYKKELAARVSAHEAAQFDYYERRQSAQREQESKGEALWNKFREDHPDYAGNQKLVEFAAGEVLNRAIAKGVDAQKYVYGTQDQFFTDIVAEMDQIAPKPKGDGGEGDPADDEPLRTGGLPGGSEGGGKPSGSGDNAPGDMVKDLQDMQRKEGFF